MSGQLVQELLNGGLVTKRHPTMLAPGELQQADDCVYRQFDPAIHAAPGRSEYNSSALGSVAVKGLAYLPFDRDTDLLLAYHDATLKYSELTTTTGSFNALPDLVDVSDSAAGTMNSIPYGDRYYLAISGTEMRRVGYARPSAQIISCTITNTTSTVTTAVTNGFRNIIVGQYVSGTGVPAGARVTAKASNTSITITSSAAGGPLNLTFADTSFLQTQYAGMRPVTESPTVSTVSGSWSTAADMGAGYYWFIYTEMVMPGPIDDVASGFLESGFTGTMVVGTITTPASEAISVARATNVANTAVNRANAATHWQIYMSDRQVDTRTKPSLATFKRVGDPISIATTSITLTDVNLYQGPRNPSTNTTLTGYTTMVTPTGAYTQHDGTNATILGSLVLGNTFGGFGLVATGAITGGTLAGGETVMGIKIRVFGRYVKVNVRPRTSTGKLGVQKDTQLGDWSTATFGGATDTWGESWATGDFADGTFFVDVIAYANLGATTLGRIDGIDVQVFYTGTSVNRNGSPFRTVTYRSQVGTTVTDTVAFSMPPSATTGDVFQGSLVVNDPTDPPTIRFSLPGIADTFPKPYFLRFNLARKDAVTNIKRVGQVLLVGMRDSIQRVNYLPTELDTSLTDGLAHEDLTVEHGIVGPHAAVSFDMPGAGVLLSYVSQKGIHITDGITSRYMNMDLDWATTVDSANLSTCILRNYPQENWLVLFYAPYGTSHGKNTRALIFPYSPDKIKEGGSLPAVGPIKVSARSAETIVVAGKSYLVTGHQALGKVYVEDQGLTLPSGYTVADEDGDEAAITLSPTFTTRRVYLSGIGRQSRKQRVYAMTDAHGATIEVESTTTVDSQSVGSTNGFGSVSVGMIVTGSGIPPDTVVTAKASSSALTISRPATATVSAPDTVTLSFSSGTVGLTIYGQDIGEALTELETQYQSTEVGGLMVYHADNLKESFHLKFSKVTLPDDSQVNLPIALRMHYFAYLASDEGLESHRGTGAVGGGGVG